MTESDPALPQLAGWLGSFRWPLSKEDLLNAFATQVSVVSDVLGPPTQRRAGRSPSAVWQLPHGSALKVEASSGCHRVLTSPRYVEIQRDLGPRA